MITSFKKSVMYVISLLALTFGALGVNPARAAWLPQVSLTSLGTPYTQNFDTLSNAAGTTTNLLTIDGWYLTETGGGARDNELYGVDSGASVTGDTYSYGATGATDRALGGLLSGTLIPTYGASFTNNTGYTIDTLAISYVGEEWRLGFAGRTDRIDFQYSLNATSLSDGSWTDVNALDFTTPDATAPTGAKDGNAAGYRTGISSNISGLSIPNGATFWIRWNDFDATNADDGLAVDDFSLAAYSCQHTTVSNNADSGAGTLRQAIADACAGGTIDFDNDYTILLASELVINKNLTITGTGHNITVSGNHVTRVLNLTGGTITLNQLTIADGYLVDTSYSGISGAGIYVNGATLNVSNSTFSGNTTGWPGGGGIQLSVGTANVLNCTFTGNSAISGGYGGGIDTFSGTTLNVTNSTFSGNTAASAGGGISVGGTGNIINSTISGNSADWTGGGGGINDEDGVITIRNSIIANNLANSTLNNCFNHYSGQFYGANNLANDATCGTGFTNSSSILLGTLGNYGGTTQTFPLLPGSSAIDTGDSAICAAAPVNSLDQRGVTRPAACDIGAFESQGFTLAKTGGDGQSTPINTAFTNPLALSVTSAFGEPVNGGKVAFTPPGSGASAVISGNPATIAGGAVSVTASANGTAGSYSVAANASGAADLLNFTLTNVVPTATLSIAFAGNGGNKVDSISPDNGINCLKGISGGCSASFATGLPVSLAATPDWKSAFTGWSDNAPAGVVTMESDKTVTATFDVVNRVKLMPAGTLHASIQDAYAGVPSGSMTIQAQAWSFLEDLLFNNGTAVTLAGGMDESYNPTSAYATVKSLTVGTGSAVIGNITIK